MSWHPRDLPRGRGYVNLAYHGPWATVTLASPETRNAMSPGMMADLEAAVTALERWDGVAVILTGAGERAFCSGGDLNAVEESLTAPGAGEGMSAFMGATLDRLASLPTVVIAAVEGAALGGGAELLTAVDLVVAGRGATIGFVQAALGVSPGWGGGHRLVTRVGARRALALLAFARRLSASEALAAGLVDRVVEDGRALAEAEGLAGDLAALPPVGDPTVERAVFSALWGGEAHLKALARSRRR